MIISAEAVLYSKTCSRIVPGECFFKTSDDAGAALQASVWVWMNIAVLIEGVDFGRAYEETVFWLAFGAANILIYSDVLFFVELEDILS